MMYTVNTFGSVLPPSILVAIAGQTLTNQGLRSGDNGVTWSPITYPASVVWRNIGYGGGRFVGIGGTEHSMISTDGGATFVSGGTLPAIAHPNPAVWKHLAYSPSRNRWLAAATNATNTVMASSDDGGVSWQAQTYMATTGAQNADLTYLESEDRFIYLAGGSWRYSDDGGENWSTGSSVASYGFSPTGGTVTRINGVETVCYIGDTNSVPFAAYSEDGLTWNLSSTVAGSGGLGWLAGGHEKFFATSSFGALGRFIYRSVDGGDTWDVTELADLGVAWTISPTTFGFVGLTSGVFLGSNYAMVSTNGDSWDINPLVGIVGNWTKCGSTYVSV